MPEVLDRYLRCPFCPGREKQSGNSNDNHLKEASRRCEDVTGNFLYYPTAMDFQQNNLEHFQTHWSKGHPVIVRSVLKGGSSLNWDPVAMFCNYLRNSNRKTGNTTDCMDWFEVSDFCSVTVNPALSLCGFIPFWFLIGMLLYSMTGRNWGKASFFGLFEREG